MKKKAILLAGTLDTKGAEYNYIKSLFDELGIITILIDIGIRTPTIKPDVTAEEVAGLAGYDIEKLREANDRGKAVAAMMEGLRILVAGFQESEVVAGMMGLGGSGGTSMITPAMQVLPPGIPKIMVSTLAEGDTSSYTGNSDIIMVPSIVDICGLNKISRSVFRGAVQSMAGIIGCEKTLAEDDYPDKPRIAATMYGVTTPGVTAAKKILEDNGFEVVVFHASGNGGMAMETMIYAGAFCAVLDLTTTEWCDQMFGGIMAAGEARCEAAARTNIPQVVSVGAMDIVTFGIPETVPVEYKDRHFYPHNPKITVMRTSVEENVQLGRKLAKKLRLARGNTALLLPLRGVSAIDKEGEVFYGPEEDAALFSTLKEELDHSSVPVVELDLHINDQEFGEVAAIILLEMIRSYYTPVMETEEPAQ